MPTSSLARAFALSGASSPSLHGDACATIQARHEQGTERQTNVPARVGSVRQRRGIAETSAEAFHSLSPRDYLAPKELAILALFTGPEVRLSRQQIAQAVPMLINGVCGRVDSLLSSKRLEECKERRRDPATGKSQKLLQLPRSEQGELVERGGA